MALAAEYHWTPEQVGVMDPDYIEELIARQRAVADERKAQEARERRRAEHGHRGSVVEADIAEIE